MNDLSKNTESSSIISWDEAALAALRSPQLPVECPMCHAQSVSAAWHLLDLLSRQAVMDLNCSSCKAHETLQITLPLDAPGFHPLERLPMLGEAVKEQVALIAEQIRRHAQAMPAAVFTTHPLWAEAKWNATTFQWHPTSDAPPIMGLVFEDAAAGKAIFRDAEAEMHRADRFEEIRLSIIEGAVPGQEGRPGYTVHLCPDPESLAAHATLEGFVLNPNIVPLLGQWNRHYPIPGHPPMLPRFKREFEKHGEFMLAPVTRRADGQLWCEHELGIIKHEIHFRDLADIAPNSDDPDAAALVLPQLSTPPTVGV